MFIQMLENWDKDYRVERHLKRLVRFLNHKKLEPSIGIGMHKHHIIPRSWVPKYEAEKENLVSPNKGKKAYNDGKATKFFFEGKHPKDWVEGNLVDYNFDRTEKSELTLLKISLLASSKMKERIKNGESLVNIKGEANPLSGIKRYHNPLTFENFTFREGDEIPDGLISGHYIPKEQERREKISESLSGRPHEWQDKINKNPEKIRKTAEFHKGRNRSNSTKQKQSESKRRFFDEGGVQHNKGKKFIFNIKTLETSYAYPDDKLEEGWEFGNLGTKKFWFESPLGEKAKFTIKRAPEGWVRICV